jgi:hypothetical protein
MGARLPCARPLGLHGRGGAALPRAGGARGNRRRRCRRQAAARSGGRRSGCQRPRGDALRYAFGRRPDRAGAGTAARCGGPPGGRPAAAGHARRRMVAARLPARPRTDRRGAGRQPHAGPGRRSRHDQCRRLPGGPGKRRAPRQPGHREPADGLGRRPDQPHQPRHPRGGGRRGTAHGRRRRPECPGARPVPGRRRAHRRDRRRGRLRQYGDAPPAARPAGGAARPRALRRRRARCRRCEGARTGAGGESPGPGCTWRRSSAASSAATM